MKLVAYVYGLVTCYAFLRGAICVKDVVEDADDSKDRRDDIIQEVVRSLLGVKEVSESDGTPRRTPPTPPRYMLDLYDRYKSGQTPVQGNTVRSILPMRGKLKGVDMLVFNLTGIDADEQILQGKLHIFRRRQSKRGSGGRKREVVRLKITDLSLKSPPHWVDVPKQKNSGWQSFDVTESVIRCRNAQHDGDHLLGVSSEFRRPNGKYKSVPIRRIARLSTQPFLIIFSEDRNNRTLNSTAEQETVSPSYEEIREMLLSRRNNGTEDRRSTEGSPVLRNKRSVRSEAFLNNLPGVNDISEPEKRKNGSVEDHRRDDSKDGRRKTYNSSVPALPKESETSEHRKKSQKSRKVNRRKKQKEKSDSRSITDRKCQRKDLIVDFSVLGWNDWIVLPQSFNAYYCTGSCANPLSQTNISNHAVIQSVLHANKDFRVNSEKVPAPCCVPSSTKSLEVFYVNKMGMTLLRNFPDMIVESCACR